jgi:hypothetical protein
MTTLVFTDTTKAVRDWLRDNAAELVVDSARINLGTVDGDASQIVVQRVGGGDDTSDAPLDQALVQIDCWHGTSYNTASNVKNKVRALLKELRTKALSTGGGATTGYGATVLAEVFSPDPQDNSPRFILTVAVTARAT